MAKRDESTSKATPAPRPDVQAALKPAMYTVRRFPERVKAVRWQPDHRLLDKAGVDRFGVRYSAVERLAPTDNGWFQIHAGDYLIQYGAVWQMIPARVFEVVYIRAQQPTDGEL